MKNQSRQGHLFIQQEYIYKSYEQKMKMVGHLLEEKPSYQIQYAKGLSFFRRQKHPNLIRLGQALYKLMLLIIREVTRIQTQGVEVLC